MHRKGAKTSGVQRNHGLPSGYIGTDEGGTLDEGGKTR